jgi:hypothetical protein
MQSTRGARIDELGVVCERLRKAGEDLAASNALLTAELKTGKVISSEEDPLEILAKVAQFVQGAEIGSLSDIVTQTAALRDKTRALRQEAEGLQDKLQGLEGIAQRMRDLVIAKQANAALLEKAKSDAGNQ